MMLSRYYALPMAFRSYAEGSIPPGSEWYRIFSKSQLELVQSNPGNVEIARSERDVQVPSLSEPF